MKIYSDNFQKLTVLLPSLLTLYGESKLTALGSDDVNVQIVHRHENRIELRLSHHLALLDGRAIPDPDVTLAIYPLAQTVEVLTHEDCFGQRRVYCDVLKVFSPLAQRDLNNLLGDWLTKLLTENRQVALD